MKLGLLGYPVEHSLSPVLYKRFLGNRLSSYELFSCPSKNEVPSLPFFQTRLDGLNITSPYKEHFVPEIIIPQKLVEDIGAVNTLAFKDGEVLGTNTDLVAILQILGRYQETYSSIQIILLGDGVMARVTKLVARELNLPLKQFSRKKSENFYHLDLRNYNLSGTQTLIINACSRDYIFHGCLEGSEIFWDYNYSFIPHQSTIPSQVFSYQDGREMLELQAQAAISFWETYL